MKKAFVLLLIFVLTFSFAACNQYRTPIENIVQLDFQTGNRIPITISATEAQEIVAILNDGKWIEDGVNSPDDYEFTVNGVRMGYIASGFFREYDRGYAHLLILSEADTQRVNEILGYQG